MDNITEKIEDFVRENEKHFVGKLDIVVKYLLTLFIDENSHLINPIIVKSLQKTILYLSNFNNDLNKDLYLLELDFVLNNLFSNIYGYEFFISFIDSIYEIDNDLNFVSLPLQDILVSYYELNEFITNNMDESSLDIIFSDLLSFVENDDDENTDMYELNFDV